MEKAKYGKQRGDYGAPTCDSTKAALDELAERINGAVEHYIAISDEFNDRLTALEAKAHNNRTLIGMLAAKCGIPEDLVEEYNEDRSPDNPEAKVDAPRVSSNTWNVTSPWKQCPKCGTWHDESHNCVPDTCGNCSRPARWDNDPWQIACGYPSGDLKLYSVRKSACPYYDRREEV